MKYSPENCRHLCVDMQRMFTEDTDWYVAWMDRIRVPVAELAAARPHETVFTRFIPPHDPSEAHGAWRRYYEKWQSMTQRSLGGEPIQLLPELQRLVPPATVIDKRIYSPWLDGRLDHFLRRQGVATVIVSGGETDVCVLATVLGAVDLGYNVVLIRDAICSSFDPTHDASLELLTRRFSAQVDVATMDEVFDWWR